MSKAGRIIFWIIYPILAVLTALFLLFYLDMANGPLYTLIVEIILLVISIAVRIFLRNRKFHIRMIPTISFFLLTIFVLLLAKPTVEAKSAAYYDNPESTEVLTLVNGDVKGVYNKDKSVEIYAGIPYATAERWKEPVAMTNWEGVKDCSHFGPRSMQPDRSQLINGLVELYAEKSWHPNFNMKPLEPKEEGGLYLNIWRPSSISEKLPILVYIHGGSLTTGSSTYEDYNGEEVAKKGVIMITIQYRLGIFGYFAHPSLKEESPNHTTGNYGLLDQIQALKWVNENADLFGGDKDNITIAGESAGSSSVSALCSSPLANGLFKNAIGESSSVVVKTPPHTYRTLEDAYKTADKIMKEMNCTTIAEMRALSPERLLETQYENSSMTLDGFALSKNPYEVYLNKENNEQALLNGFNVLEADAFVIPQYLFSPTNKDNIHERLVDVFDEQYANKIETVYKDKIGKDAFSALNEIFSV